MPASRAAGPRSIVRLALAAAAAACTCPSARADALDEDAWRLAAGAGYGHLHADGRAGGGLTLGVEARSGLSDTWALRAAVNASWTAVPAAGARPPGRTRAVLGAAGASWSYDVLRVVPFVDLGVALADVRGGAVREAHGALGFEVGLGADYLLDRSWALAAAARARYLPIVFGAPDVDVGRVWSVEVGLSLSRTFD